MSFYINDVQFLCQKCFIICIAKYTKFFENAWHWKCNKIQMRKSMTFVIFWNLILYKYLPVNMDVNRLKVVRRRSFSLHDVFFKFCRCQKSIKLSFTHQKMAKPDVMSTTQDKKGPLLKPTKIGRLKKYFFIHLIRKSVYFCMLILFQSLSYFWCDSK